MTATIFQPKPETKALVDLLTSVKKGGRVPRAAIYKTLEIKPGENEDLFYSRLNSARNMIKDSVYEFIKEGEYKGDLARLTADQVATMVGDQSRKKLSRSATRGIKKLQTVDPVNDKLTTDELRALASNGFILKTVKRVTEEVTYKQVSGIYDPNVNNTAEAEMALLARMTRLAAKDVARDQKRRGKK